MGNQVDKPEDLRHQKPASKASAHRRHPGHHHHDRIGRPSQNGYQDYGRYSYHDNQAQYLASDGRWYVYSSHPNQAGHKRPRLRKSDYEESRYQSHPAIHLGGTIDQQKYSQGDKYASADRKPQFYYSHSDMQALDGRNDLYWHQAGLLPPVTTNNTAHKPSQRKHPLASNSDMNIGAKQQMWQQNQHGGVPPPKPPRLRERNPSPSSRCREDKSPSPSMKRFQSPSPTRHSDRNSPSGRVRPPSPRRSQIPRSRSADIKEKMDRFAELQRRRRELDTASDEAAPTYYQGPQRPGMPDNYYHPSSPYHNYWKQHQYFDTDSEFEEVLRHNMDYNMRSRNYDYSDHRPPMRRREDEYVQLRPQSYPASSRTADQPQERMQRLPSDSQAPPRPPPPRYPPEDLEGGDLPPKHRAYGDRSQDSDDILFDDYKRQLQEFQAIHKAGKEPVGHLEDKENQYNAHQRGAPGQKSSNFVDDPPEINYQRELELFQESQMQLQQQHQGSRNYDDPYSKEFHSMPPNVEDPRAELYSKPNKFRKANLLDPRQQPFGELSVAIPGEMPLNSEQGISQYLMEQPKPLDQMDYVETTPKIKGRSRDSYTYSVNPPLNESPRSPQQLDFVESREVFPSLSQEIIVVDREGELYTYVEDGSEDHGKLLPVHMRQKSMYVYDPSEGGKATHKVHPKYRHPREPPSTGGPDHTYHSRSESEAEMQRIWHYNRVFDDEPNLKPPYQNGNHSPFQPIKHDRDGSMIEVQSHGQQTVKPQQMHAQKVCSVQSEGYSRPIYVLAANKNQPETAPVKRDAATKVFQPAKPVAKMPSQSFSEPKRINTKEADVSKSKEPFKGDEKEELAKESQEPDEVPRVNIAQIKASLMMAAANKDNVSEAVDTLRKLPDIEDQVFQIKAGNISQKQKEKEKERPVPKPRISVVKMSPTSTSEKQSTPDDHSATSGTTCPPARQAQRIATNIDKNLKINYSNVPKCEQSSHSERKPTSPIEVASKKIDSIIFGSSNLKHRAKVSDALTELEEMYENLDLNNDSILDGAARRDYIPLRSPDHLGGSESGSGSVKSNLSASNVHKFHKKSDPMTQHSGSLEYTKKWLSDDEVKTAESRHDSGYAEQEDISPRGDVPVHGNMVFIKPMPRKATENSSDDQPQSKSGSYLSLPSGMSPSVSQDSLSQRSRGGSPRARGVVADAVFDDMSYRKARSSNSPQVESTLPNTPSPTSADYLRPRHTEPARARMRFRPEREPDVHHDDLAYRRLRQDVSPVQVVWPKSKSSEKSVVYEKSLRTRSSSLGEISYTKDKPPQPNSGSFENRERRKEEQKPRRATGPGVAMMVELFNQPSAKSLPDLTDQSMYNVELNSYGDIVSECAAKETLIQKEMHKTVLTINKSQTQTPRTVKQRNEKRTRLIRMHQSKSEEKPEDDGFDPKQYKWLVLMNAPRNPVHPWRRLREASPLNGGAESKESINSVGSEGSHGKMLSHEMREGLPRTSKTFLKFNGPEYDSCSSDDEILSEYDNTRRGSLRVRSQSTSDIGIDDGGETHQSLFDLVQLFEAKMKKQGQSFHQVSSQENVPLQGQGQSLRQMYGSEPSLNKKRSLQGSYQERPT